MTDTCQFIVLGVPAPQGSKSAFVRGGRAVVVDGSSATGRAKHQAWRQSVAACAAARLLDDPAPFCGPTAVSLRFWLPATKSDPYRTRHATRPDLDKLVRATLDGLVEGGLLADDSLVYQLEAVKAHATAGHWTGAEITLNSGTALEIADRAALKEQAKRARSTRRN